MNATWWKSFLKNFAPRKSSPNQRRRSLLAGVESLEQRQLMATRVWDGGSVTSDAWTNRFNWEGNDAPVAGDSLVFPDSIRFTDRGLNNDFPTGTDFNNITIEGQAYLFRGNRIDLLGNLTYHPKTDTTIDNTKINLDIRFSSGDHTIEIIEGANSQAREELQFNGVLSDTGSGNIFFKGDGNVIFGGNNANDIDRHTLVVENTSDEDEIKITLDKPNNVPAIAGPIIVGLGGSVVVGETGLNNITVDKRRLGQLSPGIDVTLRGGFAAGFLSVSRETIGALTMDGGTMFIIRLEDSNESAGGAVTLTDTLSVIGTESAFIGSDRGLGQIRLNPGSAEPREFNIAQGASLKIIEGLTDGNLLKTGEGALFIRPGRLDNTHGTTTVNAGALVLASGFSEDTPQDGRIMIPNDLIVRNGARFFHRIHSNAIADTATVQLDNGADFNMSGGVEETVRLLTLNNASRIGIGNLDTQLTVTETVTADNTSFIAIFDKARVSFLEATHLRNSRLSSNSGSSLILEDLELTNGTLDVIEDETSVTIAGNITSNASTIASAILGKIKLTPGTHNFNVANGAVGNDLTISAIIGDLVGVIGGGEASISKNGTGKMVLTGNNTYSGTTTLNQGTLTINGVHSNNQKEVIVNAGILAGNGQVRQINQVKGIMNPGNGIGVLKATDSTFFGAQSRLVLQLNGPTATEFDRLKTGRLLGNPANPPTLDIRLGFTPNIGQKFRIVDITGADPIDDIIFKDLQGNPLPEGSRFTVNGLDFTISYTGGTGNDVVITRNTPPAFQNISITPQVNEGEKVFITGTITEPNPNDTFLLDVDWGDGTTKTYYFPPGSPRTVTAGHIYADDRSGTTDTYAVSIHWRDQFGGTNGAQLSTIVRNSSPVIEDITVSLPPINAGEQFTLQGLISDRSSQDTFKVYIQWTTGGAWESVNLAAGATTFTFQHAYAVAGNYNVSVIVLDDDLGLTQRNLTIQVV
jgi:autotransporter-associated beta strand protein